MLLLLPSAAVVVGDCWLARLENVDDAGALEACESGRSANLLISAGHTGCRLGEDREKKREIGIGGIVHPPRTMEDHTVEPSKLMTKPYLFAFAFAK